MTRPERNNLQWVVVFEDGSVWLYLDLSVEYRSPAFQRVKRLLYAECRRRNAIGLPSSGACRLRLERESVENDFTPEEYGEMSVAETGEHVAS